VRIKSVSFRNVGPFGADGVKLEGFTPGLNVVCKTNEFGKSTVLKALEMVLFKPFSSADKQIKALRTANSDGAPEGEICFSSEGKDYLFSKRFLKSKGARLQDAHSGAELAVDRAAEEALAKLLRGDKFESGPSGLLWVRQGKSMDGIADNGQIASRLEGELGTLIGGERAREYLTRVETELAEVLTKTGQERKGGALKNARDAVEATHAELSEATRLRDLTTAIGVELIRVTGEITRISGEAEDENLAE
jgi:DNA repair exonuclease SbcCD ATPase subunit